MNEQTTCLDTASPNPMEHFSACSAKENQQSEPQNIAAIQWHLHTNPAQFKVNLYVGSPGAQSEKWPAGQTASQPNVPLTVLHCIHFWHTGAKQMLWFEGDNEMRTLPPCHSPGMSDAGQGYTSRGGIQWVAKRAKYSRWVLCSRCSPISRGSKFASSANAASLLCASGWTKEIVLQEKFSFQILLL